MEVVEAKGKIIGYLCGGISDKLVYRNTAKYAELENMLIEENFRGGWNRNKIDRGFYKLVQGK